MAGVREVKTVWLLAAALGSLLAAEAVLFGPALLGQQVFFERDVHLLYASQARAIADGIQPGVWPLWNPYISFGQPLLGNPNFQLLYPFTALLLLLPAWACYTAYVAFHLAFAGTGVVIACRSLGRSAEASLAAGLLCLLAGPFVSLANLWIHLGGAAWIPWVFLATLRAVRDPCARTAVVWGLAVSGQVATGSPDLATLSLLVTVLQVASAIDWRAPGSSVNRRIVWTALGGAVVTLCVTAMVWLPALDLLSRSARRGLPAEMRTLWSVSPLALATTLWPVQLDPLPISASLRATLYDSREAFLASLYLGLATLPLVLAALLASFPGRRLLLAVLLLAALFALGRHAPFHGALGSVVPLLGMLRFPVKAMPLLAFAWAMLAAQGLDGWATISRRWRTALAGSALLLALLAAAAGLALATPRGAALLVEHAVAGPPPEAVLAPVTRQLLATALITAFAAALSLWSGRARPLLLAALVDLALAHTGLHPLAPRELWTAPPPLLDQVAGHGRLYVYEYHLLPGSAQRLLGREHAFDIRGLVDRSAGRLGSPWLAAAMAQRAYLLPPVAGAFGVRGSYDIDQVSLYAEPLEKLGRLLRAAEGRPVHERLLRMAAVGRVVALHRDGLESCSP